MQFYHASDMDYRVPSEYVSEFTSDELDSFRSVFRQFDANGDGGIDANELATVLNQLGENSSQSRINEYLREADEDGNNSIEWLEFLKGWVDVVEFVEQPLAPGLEAAMLAARAESGIEIALDESLNGAGAARWLGEWPGVLVVKAPLMGDFARLQTQLEPLAERVVLSSVFETGIGFLNTMVLAGALPKLNLALGFDTLQFLDALGGRKDGAVIAASDCMELNPEEIWNANRHLI